MFEPNTEMFNLIRNIYGATVPQWLGPGLLFMLVFSVPLSCQQTHSPNETPSKPRPNVVLIMADDVGYESFEPYGSTQYETPNLDRLAGNGMTFTHAYAQPLCTPSRVKIMTGKSNIRNYTGFGLLHPEAYTFGHLFQNAGYATAAAGKWQLLGADHYEHTAGLGSLPDEAGFDTWFLWQVHKRTNRYWKPWFNVDGELQSYGESYGPNVCTSFLTDFIKQTHRNDQRFFAYYPMMLPHRPFVHTPDSDSKKQSKQEHFEDMVTYIDTAVGRIVDTVDRLGIRENTLIIFTSDNGAHKNVVSELNGRTIRGRKSKPLAAGMRVPLIASMPGTIPAGTRNTDLVDLSDVMPTLADMARVSLPDDDTTDGVSFAPQLRGNEGTPRDWLFCYYWPRPVQNPDWRPERRFAFDKEWKLYADGRLYHWSEDPLEQNMIEQGEGGPAARRAREKLGKALDSMPQEPQRILRKEDVQ